MNKIITLAVVVVVVTTNQQNTNNNDELLFLLWNSEQSDVGVVVAAEKHRIRHGGEGYKRVTSKGNSRLSKTLHVLCSPCVSLFSAS